MAHHGYGQLSPGQLASDHAHLEGIRNCTQCHDIGNKVPDSKCLACHTEIEELINARRGLHASSNVTTKDCLDCHSEHHGRKFDMVRFNQDDFEHAVTGYELEGQHKIIDCRACHMPDNIVQPEIKKRNLTFLGLETDCTSCHEDYHQGTLSENCMSCHNYDAFRPAVHFNHDETKFQLNGAHADVNCASCHATTIRNGEQYQEFSGLSFNTCTSCHDNPHPSQSFNACTQCHVETEFSNFIGNRGFDHNRTDFALNGMHKELTCFECHSNTTTPALVFQDKVGVPSNDCVSCHEDIHQGKFGGNCVQCHNEVSFLELKSMEYIDHSVTDFPLEGLHTTVDCKACHIGRYTEPLDFQYCNNCHSDYHEGEFATNNVTPDCVSCHTVEKDFGYSLYTLDRHNSSSFPLEGSHLATPCFSCHLSDSKWSFRNIGTTCVDCHEDVHETYIDEQYYPSQECTQCHNPDTWADVQFDHTLTDWPLEGEHAHLKCRVCHYDSYEESGIFNQRFETLKSDCIACHQDIHQGQFDSISGTDCRRCHDTQNWSPSRFNHSDTAFPLTGRHEALACDACHKDDEENGQSTVRYKLEKFACIDCHR